MKYECYYFIFTILQKFTSYIGHRLYKCLQVILYLHLDNKFIRILKFCYTFT